MKILIINDSDAGPSHVRNGWRRVFEHLGHEVKMWATHKEPAFDAFAEFQPDIYIGTTYEPGLSSAVIKCLKRLPECRVALFASGWGDIVDNLDREKYPIVYVTEEEIGRVGELQETGQLKFVFIHATDEYLPGILGGWETIGAKPVGILNAADSFLFSGGRYRSELDCDAFFCGGYWPYKAQNLDPYILGLPPQLSVRIHGRGHWPTARYFGAIDVETERDYFLSAKVCLNVSEPHSQAVGADTVERLFKAAYAGGFVVSDYIEEAEKLFGDCIHFCRTSKEFHETVEHFAQNPDERLSFIQKSSELFRREHTYFNRVQKMLMNLGFEEEAKRCVITDE